MKILLATDGSEFAEEAAWLLAHLPHLEPLELTILAVCKVPEVHKSMEIMRWMQQFKENEKLRSAEAIERVERMFDGADVRIEKILSEGQVSKQIVTEAESRKVDLIVLGAVGHSAVERALLGSISDVVATHATCSVLTIRPTGLRAQPGRDLRLCVAYDDGESSEYAIGQLSRFGWGAHTEIDVVHVVLTSPVYGEVPFAIDPQQMRSAMMPVVEQAVDRLAELSPSITPHVVDSVHIGERLVRFASDQSSDIIIMGDRGRGALGRFFLGSVSRYVLRHAHCSVWIARGPT